MSAARNRSPDIDFESLMDKQGVTRLEERESQRRGRPGGPAGPYPRQTTTTTPSEVATPDHLALLVRAKEEFRRLEAERDAANAASQRADSRAEAALTRATLAETHAAAAEARADAAESRALEARKGGTRAQEAVAAAEARAARATEARDAALALLDEAKAAAPTPQRLDAVLARIGIDAGDFGLLAAALSGAGQLGELLRRLRIVPDTELAHFLDDRVAWTCDACAPVLDSPQRTRVRVPPEHCDVCGGSSIQAAAQRFAQACQRAGVTRVLLVGGSPTYHDTLQRLGPSLGNVKLKLIRGDGARDRQRAGQDLAGAEVAFIWASTVLDHRVGELYRGPKVHTLPVRGIGRMLTEAAKRIAGH